jgi:hypothetical protein
VIPLDDLKPLEISDSVTLETQKKNSVEMRKDALRNLPWNGSHLYRIAAGVQKFQRYRSNATKQNTSTARRI